MYFQLSSLSGDLVSIVGARATISQTYTSGGEPMTNLAPVLLHLLGPRDDWPGFEIEPRQFYPGRPQGVAVSDVSRLPVEEALRFLGEALETSLKPVPIDQFLEEGRTGLPRLRRDELQSFLSDAAIVSHPPESTRWLECVLLRDGTFIVVPNDRLPLAAMELLTAPPVAPGVYRLRRISTGLVISNDGSPTTEPPRRLREPCSRDLHVTEPGSPYVGTCRETGCSGTCRPNVVFEMETGTYVLAGCECPL